MSRRIAVILQFLFIAVFLVFLYQEYRRVGHFQWVDPDAIEDQEEFFATPFAVSFLIGGICSLFCLLGFGQLNANSFPRLLHNYFLRPVAFMYTICCIAMGIIFFIVITAGAVIVAVGSLKEFIIFLILIFGAIGYVTMGVLTMKFLRVQHGKTD
jgi:hypothetical protein